MKFKLSNKKLDPKLFLEMNSSIDDRKTWDKFCKEIRLIERISDNSDIIYYQWTSPAFFIKNRDYVIERYWFNNKDDADLVKKYKLPFKENNYWVIFNQSIEHASCPPIPKIVRAKLVFSLYFIEEDPLNPNTFTLYGIEKNDLGGRIPYWILNSIYSFFGDQVPKELEEAYENYVKKRYPEGKSG